LYIIVDMTRATARVNGLVVFIIDHIHHLTNESKMLIFAYIND